MSEPTNRAIRELEQVNILLKKLIMKNNTSNLEPMSQRITELEQASVTAKKFIEQLLNDKSTLLSDNVLEQIHHNIKTPMTPIKGYVELLMSEKFGPLNENQKQKLKIVSENIDNLDNAIKKYF